MGNLGRVGYGGTLEGTWPYTYDSCDSGTLSNQTKPDGTPEIVKTGNIWCDSAQSRPYSDMSPL